MPDRNPAHSDRGFDELRRRLTVHGVDDVRTMAGGASSLTFQGTLRDTPVVVKVAPAKHLPVGHRDVLRQARIMRALAPTPVPVPDVLIEDAGDPPGVPPLFVMGLVDGESFEPLFDPPGAAPESELSQRYRSAAQTMATLHGLRPESVGARDEPVVDAAAEVTRWSAALQTVDPALAPGWSEVRDALVASVPEPIVASVVHGDFRLGNLLAQANRIVAVIDWEIWSVGDPRIDLGWFLVNAQPDTYRRATPYAALVPSTAELVATYRDAYGTPVPDVEWFMALACFKSTATWSLIVKHNRRRPTPQPDLESMAQVLPRLLSKAARLLN